MNTRIDELAWQAGCHKTMQHDPVRPEGSGWIIDQETLDKFAELIVNECSDICFNREYAYGCACGEAIQRHFT